MSIQRELPSEKFKNPIFLTGCMRSGTSFLANLLTEHPQLLLLEGELLKVWSEIGGIDCINNRKYADRNDLATDSIVNMTAYFQKCYHHYSSAKYYLWRLVDLYKKGSGGLKKDWGKLFLFNKNVHLINKLDYVLSMFPESKIILIIRPIESQVNSLKLHFEGNARKNKFFHKPNDEKDSWITSSSLEKNIVWDFKSLAEKWIQLNKTALRDLENCDENRCYILDYVKMVNNGGAILKDIYGFLGLDNFNKFDIKNSLSDRRIFNTNTFGNPMTDWKTRLTEKELQIIDEVKNKMRDDYQYIQQKLNN